MPRTWIAEVDELSPPALTVRAQTMSPLDMGMLHFPMFFPRRNVNSVRLDDITTIDYRPVADRREWNAPGRYIPSRTPARRRVEIVPINPYFKIDEYEMQILNEGANGNEATIREVVGASIPDRVDVLVDSIFRRVDVDAMAAWANGAIVQKNPQDGSTYTASFSFDAGRYTTAGTAWNDAGVNAYDELIAWLMDAIDAIGGIEGIILRQAHLNAIQADAPDLIGGVSMTRAQLASRIQDDLGSPFTFAMVEDSYDIFTDGGTAYTRTKVWPSTKIAAVPAGTVAGYTAFAPVVRAMEMARSLPGAGIDTRGVTVYYDEFNTGRELQVEAQANAVTIPDEQKMFVINVGF